MEAVGTPPGTTAQPQFQEGSFGRPLSMDDGTQTTITVTSAVTTTHHPRDLPGQSPPPEVSQPSEQMDQEAESQSADSILVKKQHRQVLHRLNKGQHQRQFIQRQHLRKNRQSLRDLNKKG